jgi:hypothetical protein
MLLQCWLRDSFVETLPDAFRIMLIGTSFIGLVGGLPYYVIMGCGKARCLIVSNTIAAGCNCLLVVAYGWVSGHLSVRSIGWCMTASCLVSAAYLIGEVRRLLARWDLLQTSRSRKMSSPPHIVSFRTRESDASGHVKPLPVERVWGGL